LFLFGDGSLCLPFRILHLQLIIRKLVIRPTVLRRAGADLLDSHLANQVKPVSLETAKDEHEAAGRGSRNELMLRDQILPVGIDRIDARVRHVGEREYSGNEEYKREDLEAPAPSEARRIFNEARMLRASKNSLSRLVQ